MKKEKILKITGLCFVLILAGLLLHLSFQNLFASGAKNQQDLALAIPAAVSTAKNLEPITKPEIKKPDFTAKSVVSIYTDKSDNEKVLYQKNPDEKLLIASLTKLTTAAIAFENYDLNQKVTIDEADVLQGGFLRAGESFSIKNLLYAALIGSDNSAAYALSKVKDKSWFVGLMNQKAKDFGLTNTYFSNSVGFGQDNHSTALELAKLTDVILRQHPIIFDITNNAKYGIYNFDGSFHHTVYSTNNFLTGVTPADWKNKIVGSKTGNNELAGECLIIVLSAPNNDGYLINVILDSKDRFGDMKKLVDWENIAYNW